MELRDYLDVFKKRWIVIAVVTILVIMAVLVFSFAQEPVYEAKATCMVSATATLTGQGEFSAIQIIEKLLETINNIAISRPVLESASGKLRSTRSVDQLKHSITSKVLTDTQLISISARDAEPLTAMLEANAAADSLIEFVNRNEGNGTYKIEKVEPPTRPISPVSPKPLRNGILGGILGLILGIAVAAVLESIDVSVKSTEELGQLLERPVLAEIPRSNESTAGAATENGPGDSGILEATRTLRTNIQYMDIDGNLRTILIASPSLREGKTFISRQLARAFAAIGKKVILVDADLRKTEHDLEENAQGLTDVIIGTADLEAVIRNSEAEQFDLLPSGPLPPNPSEMLDSQAMHKILDTLRSSYDIVIIDSSPIGMFSDPFVLASRTDGTILVVEARSTSAQSLKSAVQLLSGTNINLLGAVLNKVKLSRRHNYDYYYYKSGRRKKRLKR
jgi:succinoglycan biosynthesis transport protein ExoP